MTTQEISVLQRQYMCMLQDLLDKYEDLFISMSKTYHCLYHILPPARHLDSLRERGHPFSLPNFSTSIPKKSFVVRTLYKFI